jgi:putative SOS response-associated peptidase YedK
MRIGGKRYRAVRSCGGHFYIAAVWEPDSDGRDPFFRVITVAANPDIACYQDRHGAIVPSGQVERWLDPATPSSACLSVPPAGFFHVTDRSPRPRQRSLTL